MRAISYPPFIVFFDTIALILFVLILNQTAGASFVLPSADDGYRVFKNAELLYKKDGLMYYEDGSPYNIQRAGFITLITCTKHKSCRMLAQSKRADSIYVLVPDYLYAEGAKLVMTAINQGCSGLNVYIALNGQIDRNVTYEKNVCLQNVNGVANWLKQSTTN